jgi:hypothetical protein
MKAWVFQVLDLDDQPASLSIGVEGGYVTCRAPKWWKADPDTARKIQQAQAEAEALARGQRP